MTNGILTVQIVAIEDSKGKRRYVPLVQWTNSNYTELHLCNQHGQFARGMPKISRSEIKGAWCDKGSYDNRFRK